jgi:hypothetical protein
MSQAIFCHGCGQPLEVPEDYPRAKMRCPQCGVICNLPPPEARGRKPKSEEAEPKPAAPPRSKPPQRKPEKPRPAATPRPAPPDKSREPSRAVTASPPPARPRQADDDDDGQPYEVTGGPERLCPECGKLLEDGAVLCVRCGLNTATGEKKTQTFQPLQRHWVTGWGFQARLIAFIVGEVVAFVSGTAAILLGADPCTFVTTFLMFSAMLGFLVGTWETLDLERNTKGRVRLTKTFRLYFFPASVKKINLGEYEGVITGKSHEVTFLDWIMLFILCGFALIPGIIFFYLAFFKHSFYVALVRDHGNPEVTLYRGGNEAQMRDIEHTVRDAGRWRVDLPLEK